jgi:HSP20 family protein
MLKHNNVVQKDGKNQPASTTSPDAFLRPPVDVIEDSSGITLLADLPGVPRDKLNIQLESDSLTIEGEVMLDLPQDMQSNLAEVSIPRYRRVFTLSKELDGEKASAELNNGVLKLHIPKAQHAQPRKIQINAA